jgi:hypothetical protein
MKLRSSPLTEILANGATGGVLLHPGEAVVVGTGVAVGVVAGCCVLVAGGVGEGDGAVTLGAQAENKIIVRSKHPYLVITRRPSTLLTYSKA